MGVINLNRIFSAICRLTLHKNTSSKPSVFGQHGPLVGPPCWTIFLTADFKHVPRAQHRSLHLTITFRQVAFCPLQALNIRPYIAFRKTNCTGSSLMRAISPQVELDSPITHLRAVNLAESRQETTNR